MKNKLLSLIFPILVFSQEFNVTSTQEFRDALLEAQYNGQKDLVTLLDGNYNDDGDSKIFIHTSDNCNLTINTNNNRNISTINSNIVKIYVSF